MRNRIRNLRQHKLFQLYADNSPAGAGVRSQVDGTRATIFLYDIIDSYFGVSALTFAAALNQVRDASEILLRINSPGGDVFEGRAIASLLTDVRDRLTVQVDGIAASAATTVAIQGRDLVMMRGSFFMIHNAWALAIGDKNSMRALADILAKVDGELAAEYAHVSGMAEADVAKMMDDETWMTPQEAIDNGFADRIGDGNADDGDVAAPGADDPSVAGRWNLNAYAKAPKLQIVRPAASNDDEESATATRGRHVRLRQLGAAVRVEHS